MILDLDRFVREGRPTWDALEAAVERLEGGARFDLPDVRRFHALYERTASDLARLAAGAAEPDLRRFLEGLLARAYAELHETRAGERRATVGHWFAVRFPSAFRRHLWAFWLSLAVTLLGGVFGGVATKVDPASRAITMPFGHDRMTPSERVAREEEAAGAAGAGGRGSFSTYLMTHNTRISIFTLSLGMTWGIGTLLLLFYNGVAIGSVATDYILDGQSRFLAGWLLPHGSVEIPAILIAGQAGLLLGATLLGRGSHLPLAARLRAVGPDLVTLILGVALMLVYAGIIESFLSQFHEPVVPYALKIAFGLAELAGLGAYLALAGRRAGNRSP